MPQATEEDRALWVGQARGSSSKTRTGHGIKRCCYDKLEEVQALRLGHAKGPRAAAMTVVNSWIFFLYFIMQIEQGSKLSCQTKRSQISVPECEFNVSSDVNGESGGVLQE